MNLHQHHCEIFKSHKLYTCFKTITAWVQNITCKQIRHTHFSLISQVLYFLHEYKNVTYTAMKFSTQRQNLPNDISKVQMDSWADTCILQVSNFLISQRETGSTVTQKQKRLSMEKQTH
jgi:hypothetical protein